MKLSVIIPAYNEEKTIREVLSKVLAQEFVSEIIIVDDGSKDDTYKIAKKFKDPKIKVFKHNKNAGKGASLKTGIDKVTGDFVIVQDADLEYNPSEYKKLLKHITKKSAVYGSRILANNEHAYTRTYLGNVLVTNIFNLLYKTNLTDIYTCYKLIPKDIAKDLQLTSAGFEVEAEISAKLIKKGVKVLEVPISYKPRKYHEGKKIKAKDALIGILTLIKLRFEKTSAN